MPSKFQTLLDEYSESHQNRFNKKIHWVCVPLIFWSIVALFYSIPTDFLTKLLGEQFYSNWAILMLIPISIYYLSLSIPIALGMIVFIGSCLFLSDFLFHFIEFPLWISAVIVFVLAWIGQFYGHHIEGKKPSFLKDLQFLLIGPAWLLHFIYKKRGIRY